MNARFVNACKEVYREPLIYITTADGFTRADSSLELYIDRTGGKA